MGITKSVIPFNSQLIGYSKFTGRVLCIKSKTVTFIWDEVNTWLSNNKSTMACSILGHFCIPTKCHRNIMKVEPNHPHKKARYCCTKKQKFAIGVKPIQGLAKVNCNKFSWIGSEKCGGNQGAIWRQTIRRKVVRSYERKVLWW